MTGQQQSGMLRAGGREPPVKRLLNGQRLHMGEIFGHPEGSKKSPGQETLVLMVLGYPHPRQHQQEAPGSPQRKGAGDMTPSKMTSVKL